MLVVVTVVSSLVHIFSIGYLKDDVRYSRYFAYLGFFTFSMLGIVLTNNFFTMYVSWKVLTPISFVNLMVVGLWAIFKIKLALI